MIETLMHLSQLFKVAVAQLDEGNFDPLRRIQLSFSAAQIRVIAAAIERDLRGSFGTGHPWFDFGILRVEPCRVPVCFEHWRAYLRCGCVIRFGYLGDPTHELCCSRSYWYWFGGAHAC